MLKIAPGQSHGTFVFVFDTRVANLSFQALFTNPDDLANPIVFDGVTALQAPSNGQVPEPAFFILLSTGLMVSRPELPGRGPALAFGAPRQLFVGRYSMNAPARGYDVTGDGQRFLLLQKRERAPDVVTHLSVV